MKKGDKPLGKVGKALKKGDKPLGKVGKALKNDDKPLKKDGNTFKNNLKKDKNNVKPLKKVTAPQEQVWVKFYKTVTKKEPFRAYIQGVSQQDLAKRLIV